MKYPAVWGNNIRHYQRAAATACLMLLLVLLPSTAFPEASSTTSQPVKIAIIIDDIGYNRPAGEHIIKVPGALTYAVIPFTPFAHKLATLANNEQKEVLLHLPMEATVRKKLDTGGLTVNQSKYELKDLVNNSLAAVPHVSGFNNHMGSLLTTDRKAMEWIMEEVASQDLFFIDSVTNPNTIAGKVATEHKIPNLRRDVFLDNKPSEQEIHKAFQLLLSKAKSNGYAIGIAHPHPATIDYLSTRLPTLDPTKVKLVSVSELVESKWASKSPQLSPDRLVHLVASLPAPLRTRFRFDH
ncbi:hypothetical protein A9Q99_12110 [Gammaproteobacteria bacterium 45_16_T64]|nr:hypothetical protein A9Q99_12110 [Gammaproteobacteria bacterium 45_16_T64]